MSITLTKKRSIFTLFFLCLVGLFFGLISKSPIIAKASSIPLFGLPIDCKLGQNCYIMHYVDRDPTPGIIDFRCGRQTYDGHDGIDFGIANLQQTVPVIASANGTVLNIRDGVDDRLIVSQADRDLILGRECGNGVLIDNGSGWTTQYCHMKKNSIAVRQGGKISTGSVLGMVGSSGLASFPHVHLTVRQRGKAIDPFVGINNSKSCPNEKKPLWANPIGYVSTGLISAGFAPKVPTQSELWQGMYRNPNLSPNIPSLLFWVHNYGVLTGDTERWKLTNPKGEIVVEQNKPVERDYRSWLSYTGVRKIESGKWYGQYQLIRKNQAIVTIDRKISID
jgi:murein DD-endopeptidase